ncbi:response regulator [Brevundimonas variabilis]|uniref:DNA-binding NarL/FixJ family response regulator n=1 Tax=Brevundimonas variabilis TaxID=74312 RepID=A0A7W9FHF2_9CAUL|nr:response regulator transcription factor [Brevundimonas variabilis]MBB5747389.1 DNA-binding NarL/FixJ family response regulator [Brevundimonas variabilis]
MLRLLIADDHELTREGLRSVFEREPDLQVVGEAATAEDAVARALAGGVDVAVLDIRFGQAMTGLEAARAIVRGSNVRVLMLTLHDTPEYVRTAMSAGATGFVLKDAGRSELLHAVRTVGEGRTAVPPDLIRRALEPTAGPREDDLARLTPREREVLTCIADGLTNKEIGRALGIGPGTVKVHVERVIAKLGVTDRTQAAVLQTRAQR